MTQPRLVIQDEDPELFGMIKGMYAGKHLIELSKRGKILYVVGNENTEEELWEQDNRLNPVEGTGYIGSSCSTQL